MATQRKSRKRRNKKQIEYMQEFRQLTPDEQESHLLVAIRWLIRILGNQHSSEGGK